MKILEIGTTDNKGGAAKISWEIKKELETQGHQVSMIVGYKRSDDTSVREIYNTWLNNIISKIIKKNFRARLQYHIAYHLSNDISFLPGKKIKNRPEFKSADVVHAHNLHSTFFNLKALKTLTKLKPFIWTLHDMWSITGQYPHAFDCNHWQTGGCDCNLPNTLPKLKRNNSRKLWKIKKDIYDDSKLNIVVPSNWLKEKVSQSILKNHPISLIYNGVDENIFKPAEDKNELRKKLNLPLDKKLILFASKGSKKNIWKGWNYAEEIAKNYEDKKDVVFLCVGGYEKSASQKNISSIEYIADQKKLAQYYAASDLLIYPSIADNCPLTMIEAMACGLPVLSFKTGGIPELVVHNKTGYIAEYQSNSDLMAGFDKLINLSDEEAKVMSKNCRQRVLDNFTLKQMVKQYLDLYKKILKS